MTSHECTPVSFTNDDTLALKGIAIMLMLFHHLFYEAKMFEIFEISTLFMDKKTVVSIALAGKLCVPFFVFLSGFGFARYISSLERKKRAVYTQFSRELVTQVVLNRYVKLMLGYLLIFALCFMATGIHGAISENGYSLAQAYGDKIKPFFVFVDILGLARLFNTPTLNSAWWYMTVAVTLVFLLPVLLYGYRWGGSVWGILVMLTPRACLGLNDANFDSVLLYIPTAMAGVWCAEAQVMERLRMWNPLKSVRKSVALKFLLVMSFFCVCLDLRQRMHYDEFFNALCSFSACALCFCFFSNVPLMYKILKFFGRHSMNIYSVHVFLYGYFFYSFIFYPKHPVLIFVLLLMSSLAVSIVIEMFKKKVGFYSLQNRLLNKFCPDVYSMN